MKFALTLSVVGLLSLPALAEDPTPCAAGGGVWNGSTCEGFHADQLPQALKSRESREDLTLTLCHVATEQAIALVFDAARNCWQPQDE